MNTAEFLMIASSVVPDRVAMACEGKTRTFAEMQDRVNRLANALQAMGVGQGDKVAVMALNSMEYVEVYYAGAKLGGCLRAAQLPGEAGRARLHVQQLGDGGAVRREPLPRPARRDPTATSKTVEHVICDRRRRRTACASYETLLAAARAGGDLHRRRRQRPDDRHLHDRHDGAAEGRRADLPRHVRLRDEHRGARRPERRERRRAARLGALLPRRRRDHDALVRLGRPQDGHPAAVRPRAPGSRPSRSTASPTASSCRRCSSASWSTPTSTSPTSAR